VRLARRFCDDAVGVEEGRMPERVRKWAPEAALAAVAAVVFLGCLGSLELWGKREQRAVAESIDTVDRGHWLVAEIQSRPRLEKPPLPRWTTATLIRLTGRRDEWLMRLPSALSALGMVGLVYGLGRRIGGRGVGLASGFLLCSMGYFVVELRQAGNDGPLAFFVALALYAAWRRLHGGPLEAPPAAPAEVLGPRRWTILMYTALGLGFLCKGPIAWLLVALAILPYLVTARRFGPGLRALADVWGMLLMLALALSWPVPVVLRDPKALELWMLEMGQKAGTAGITHHQSRGLLLEDWPSMTAPWTVLAAVALALPLTRGGRARWPGLWLPWWWAVGNMAMFCLWSVAKPNYYIPCLPGVALLGGVAWSWLGALGRSPAKGAGRARRLIAAHWLGYLAVAVVGPVVVAKMYPDYLGWAIAAGVALAAGGGVGAILWRRGADGLALAGPAAAMAGLVVIGYGGIGPTLNDRNGHRALAERLDEIVPGDRRVVLFYRELDEGLWYYLRRHELKPVPGSQPRYNKALDLVDDDRAGRVIRDDAARIRAYARELAGWLRTARPESPYLLIKAESYDHFAPDLAGLVTPLYREPDLERNTMVLLRIDGPGAEALAAHPEAAAPRR
jgi:4-amino-4-deoxy-L-arabinose transferase-like glycosyltransferase